MASGYSDLSEIRRDGRVYVASMKPPKINLLSGEPRRESLIEEQLTSSIVRPDLQQPQQATWVQQPIRSQGLQSSDSGWHPYGQNGSIRVSYTMTQPHLSQSEPMPGYSQTSRTTYSTQTRTIKEQTRDGSEANNMGLKEISELSRTLAEKEAALKREIAYVNQYKNPWVPKQVRDPRREPPPRVMQEKVWVKEVSSSPSSRPTSRASSTRSTTEADLLDKAAKLLLDVEEIEKKPIATEPIIINSRGNSRTASSPGPTSPSASGIQTAIIKVPIKEIDNKSPLPFAYDNFSTLGVRGNIASVGAAEPEKPYAPIFPMIKRSPSPMQSKRK